MGVLFLVYCLRYMLAKIKSSYLVFGFNSWAMVPSPGVEAKVDTQVMMPASAQKRMPLKYPMLPRIPLPAMQRPNTPQW